jgi:hypothetical protein
MITDFKDGIYDISSTEYHSSKGISRSKLMLFDKSPYHFWYETLSGLAETRESSEDMAIGSAFHTLLLEPDLFESEYAVMPACDRRTTAGKEIYADFIATSGNKTVLSQDSFTKVNAMASQIKQHEIVTTLLDEARFERSIFWTDKETGIQFKTRPDIWSSKMVVDLKTTKDCTPYRFERSALDNGYYLQAGMAFEACKAIGKPFEMFVILCCEKKAPYIPAVFMLSDEALQYGIDQFSIYKKRLKECLDTNKWPGYPVIELNVPKYAQINEDQL